MGGAESSMSSGTPVGAMVGDDKYALFLTPGGKVAGYPSPPAAASSKYVTGQAGPSGNVIFQGLQLSCAKGQNGTLACDLEQYDAVGKNGIKTLQESGSTVAGQTVRAPTPVQPPSLLPVTGAGAAAAIGATAAAQPAAVAQQAVGSPVQPAGIFTPTQQNSGGNGLWWILAIIIIVIIIVCLVAYSRRKKNNLLVTQPVATVTQI